MARHIAFVTALLAAALGCQAEKSEFDADFPDQRADRLTDGRKYIARLAKTDDAFTAQTEAVLAKLKGGASWDDADVQAWFREMQAGVERDVGALIREGGDNHRESAAFVDQVKAYGASMRQHIFRPPAPPEQLSEAELFLNATRAVEFTTWLPPTSTAPNYDRARTFRAFYEELVLKPFFTLLSIKRVSLPRWPDDPFKPDDHQFSNSGATFSGEALPPERGRAPEVIANLEELLAVEANISERIRDGEANYTDLTRMSQIVMSLEQTAIFTGNEAAPVDLALQAATRFARLCAAMNNTVNQNWHEGVARRMALLRGEPLVITGTRHPDGTPFNLAEAPDFRGKVVIVSFWASWCGNCIPHITDEYLPLYRAYHQRGLEIVSISLDKDRDSLQHFIDKHSIPWTVLFDPDATTGRHAAAAAYYSIEAIPETYVLNRSGQIVWTEAFSEEKLSPLIKSLL
jgi:peroxiredoxin